MRLPRGAEVPVTAGVSGLVFVLALINFGEHIFRDEGIVFGSWALLYALECAWIAWRRRHPRRARANSMEGDAQPAAALDDGRVGAP